MQFDARMMLPSADRAEFVHTYYIIETGSEPVTESIPAYSAQLIVMVRGRLTFTFADGHSAPASGVFIKAPQLRAAQCVLEGPVLEIGASLTHAAWQRLANLPADTVHDRLIPAAAILSPDQLARLEDAAEACRAGRITPEDVCTAMGDVIAAAPFALSEDHAAVVGAIQRWLGSGFDPALSDLYASVDVSERQVQRICRRFFGVPPAQVLKRFRALRAAMVLSQPGLSQELHDELMATYFDQAHLIHDIRRYTGRTPTQLRQRSLMTGLLQPAGHGAAGAVLTPPTG